MLRSCSSKFDILFFTKGINPNLIYSITGSDGFILTDGYLVMTTQLTEGTYSLEVRSYFK